MSHKERTLTKKWKSIGQGVEARETGRIGSTRIIETRSEPRKSIQLRRPLRIVLEEGEWLSSCWAEVLYKMKIFLGDEEINRNGFGIEKETLTPELFAAVQEGRVEVELERVINIYPDPSVVQMRRIRDKYIRRILGQINFLLLGRMVQETRIGPCQ